MAIRPLALTAPEAFLLQSPAPGSGREAAKLAALTLLVQRVVRMQPGTSRGRFGRRSHPVMEVGPWAGRRDGPVGAVWAVAWGLPSGSTLADLAKAMRQRWGGGMRGYARDIVLPALERQGLVRCETTRLLGLIPIRRWHRTVAGRAALDDVEEAMDTARRIPAFLDSDPRQAAAMILAVGAAVLLVPELRPHFEEMGRLMARPQSDGSSGSDGGSGSSGDDGGRGTQGDPPFDFGALDTGALDSLGDDIGGFDSGFDAGDGGGGGGDGGGGDGGGGGD